MCVCLFIYLIVYLLIYMCVHIFIYYLFNTLYITPISGETPASQARCGPYPSVWTSHSSHPIWRCPADWRHRDRRPWRRCSSCWSQWVKSRSHQVVPPPANWTPSAPSNHGSTGSTIDSTGSTYGSKGSPASSEDGRHASCFSKSQEMNFTAACYGSWAAAGWWNSV